MAGVENDNNNNEEDDEFGNHNLEDKNAFKTIDLSDEMKRIIALRVGFQVFQHTKHDYKLVSIVNLGERKKAKNLPGH